MRAGATIQCIRPAGGRRPRLWRRAGLAAALALALAGPLSLTGCAEFLISAATTTGLAMAEERSLSHAVDDLGIQAELNHLFFQDDLELYQDVTFSVVEGRVLLKGSVPTHDDRIRAGWVAQQATGIREVINEVQVTAETGILDYASDWWISRRLNTRLLFDIDVLSINYDVETVNGTVYLLGIAQSEEEHKRVRYHASNIGGVKRIVSHVVMKDDPSRPPPP